MGLLSAPGNVPSKTFLKSLAEALWCFKTVFLSKQVRTVVLADGEMVRRFEVPGACTLLR